MTRREISDFIKSGVDMLKPATQYARGRLSEWNSLRDHSYPAVWQETSTDTPVNSEITTNLLPIDRHVIKLHIAQKDTQDSLPEQYEQIIDTADEIAQRLIFALNNEVTGYQTVQIFSTTRTPFVKKNADCITGVLLEFEVSNADTTDHCGN